MTDNIGLYVMGFMLVFAAICWVASVVCAWLCKPKASDAAVDALGEALHRKKVLDQCPSKLEPSYLADCEWPDSPHRRKVTSEDLDEIARIIKEN